MYTILGNWCDKPPERLNLLWPLINKLCLTNRLLALAQVPQKRNVKAQNKCIDQSHIHKAKFILSTSFKDFLRRLSHDESARSEE